MRLLLCVLLGPLVGCTGSLGGDDDAGRTDVPSVDSGSADVPSDTPSADTPVDAGFACPASALCESWDGYTETAIGNDQAFGPWSATLSDTGATMELDGAHTTSGGRALHVRLEAGTTSGGRLYASSGALVDAHPTHVYGRMRMFVEPSGTSVHWTFFGVEGDAEPSSPFAGSYAAYIMSSLPRSGTNTFSFVDGLSRPDGYQDCWHQSTEAMAVGRFQCVTFEMDSVARRLRMSVDGTEIAAVDGTGQGCVSPVAGDSPWYGPVVDRLFVGAWSFHPMDAPLEVWIDDLVVDTAPVACP